ncbi:MAG: hypothetical protein U0984_07840, partial [Prosthecobacter sp.]|nr:hypothetical protein [Prosthecobacter sp.]
MKIPILILTLGTLLLGLLPAQTSSPDAGRMDWRRAQGLFQKDQRGEKLNPEDRAYLDKALEMRKRGTRPGGGGGGGGGEQRKAPETLKPLSDMTADDRYEAEDGGLYGGGSNRPPEALQKAAQTALAQIQPLNAEGKPAADGRVVFVSISMSNATQEFSFFKRIADADPRKSAKLTLVDCAQGGQTMAAWAPP